MSRAQVVIALANLASQGKYEVSPVGARNMNQLFEEVAKVINSLEEEEKEAGDTTFREDVANEDS